jgi:hypothetical protein
MAGVTHFYGIMHMTISPPHLECVSSSSQYSGDTANFFSFSTVWWHDATLFCLFFIFYNIHSITFCTFIRRQPPWPLSISSSLGSSARKISLWFRAENRTRACLKSKLTRYQLSHATRHLAMPFSRRNQNAYCSLPNTAVPRPFTLRIDLKCILFSFSLIKAKSWT